ncbi:MAG: MazG nucleotide pyrophosphohydrolase domain-containing protein [Chloroflexota bacterium]
MNFKQLSDRAMEIREKFGDFELANGERKWTREDVMMGFVGDVGDLAKLVMAHQNIRAIPDKDVKLEHELADCLWSILVLARMYDIDLESAFLDTMNELETLLDNHAQQKNEPK